MNKVLLVILSLWVVLTGFLPCSVLDSCSEEVRSAQQSQPNDKDCGNCAALCACSGVSVLAENRFTYVIIAPETFIQAFRSTIPAYLPEAWFPPLIQPPRERSSTAV